MCVRWAIHVFQLSWEWQTLRKWSSKFHFLNIQKKRRRKKLERKSLLFRTCDTFALRSRKCSVCVCVAWVSVRFTEAFFFHLRFCILRSTKVIKIMGLNRPKCSATTTTAAWQRKRNDFTWRAFRDARLVRHSIRHENRNRAPKLTQPGFLNWIYCSHSPLNVCLNDTEGGRVFDFYFACFSLCARVRLVFAQELIDCSIPDEMKFQASSERRTKRISLNGQKLCFFQCVRPTTTALRWRRVEPVRPLVFASESESTKTNAIKFRQ